MFLGDLVILGGFIVEKCLNVKNPASSSTTSVENEIKYKFNVELDKKNQPDQEFEKGQESGHQIKNISEQKVSKEMINGKDGEGKEQIDKKN